MFGDPADRVGQDVLRPVFQPRFQFDRERIDDGSVGDPHEIAVGRIVVDDQREDVQVGQRVADDYRFALIGGEGFDPFFIDGGLFKPHFGCRADHFRAQVFGRLPGVAAQQRRYQFDPFAVFGFALQTDARSLTVADVVFQADAVFAFGDRFRGEIQRTRAQTVDAAHQVEHRFLDIDRSVRPEIAGTVALAPPGGLYARKRFVADHDPRIGLVVLQQDIVPRLKTFDHAVFEQESLVLGCHDRVPQVGDPRDHHAHFGALVGFRRKIGIDAAFEVFRLAYVNHAAVGPEELINARGFRQQGYFFFQFGNAFRVGHAVNLWFRKLKVSKFILHL